MPRGARNRYGHSGEPSVEAEAFRRMDAWNRQEAARRARQEELDAASQQPFPERPFNWALHVFYGGDIREAELPWLRAQVQSMAAMPPADDDGDMPAGLFVISDERAAVSAWEVPDGTVQDRPAPKLSWVLRGS